MARIHNLQGLRAYAALPVVFFHTGLVIPGLQKIGVFGVHLFFMLSGYIMASICATDRHAFMRRRLVRIIPAYWTLTAVMFLTAWKFPHLVGATRAVPMELLKSLFFIPFVKSNGLYQPILFIGWTVNYEMYFYVMLGIAVLMVGRMAPLLSTAMILAVMAVGTHFAGVSAIAHFYSDPVVLEFIGGLAAYYLVQAAVRRVSAGVKIPLFVITGITLLLLPAIEAFNLLPSLPMVVRFGPLCFVLLCSVCLLALAGSDLRAGIVVLIGDASYVMYLLHPYIEEALDRIVGRHIHLFAINTPLGCAIAMLFVVPISVLVYVKVEKPMLRYLNATVCRRRVSVSAAPSLPASTETGGEAVCVYVQA